MEVWDFRAVWRDNQRQQCFLMLPSDLGYKSPAPVAIQRLAVFQQLLSMNCDPYATHSHNPGLCRMLEAAASVATVTAES